MNALILSVSRSLLASGLSGEYPLSTNCASLSFLLN